MIPITRSAVERSSPLQRWKPADLVELAGSVTALVLILRVFAGFAAAVEHRPGVVLADPVLALLTPRDLTWVIFTVLYACVVLAIVSLAPHPREFNIGLRAYVLMVLLRMIVMYVTPLEAPPGTIPLEDPFVVHLATRQVLTRDLFFSGHTATVCILAFSSRRWAFRLLFGAAAVVVGTSVLWQAVHYTVDVLAAPAFSYLAFRIATGCAVRAPEVARSDRHAGRVSVVPGGRGAERTTRAVRG